VFALVGIAAALVVAIGAWSRFANRSEKPVAAVRERAPEKPPAPKPEPAAAPAPPPAATATNVTASPPVPGEPAVAGSNEKAPATVSVTVKVVPEDAVIFHAGKRVGAGVVEVSIENNVKQRFTALLDGYVPSNFVLDGSDTSITIMLKRAPKPRPAPPPEGESPSADAPSSDATAAPTAAAAPTATATAPTESSTQPSTEPNVAP
jgi:hypothetical protein